MGAHFAPLTPLLYLATSKSTHFQQIQNITHTHAAATLCDGVLARKTFPSRCLDTTAEAMMRTLEIELQQLPPSVAVSLCIFKN